MFNKTHLCAWDAQQKLNTWYVQQTPNDDLIFNHVRETFHTKSVTIVSAQAEGARASVTYFIMIF